MHQTSSIKHTCLHIALLAAVLLFFAGLSACTKQGHDDKRTLRQLHRVYSQGEISECKYKGELVYTAGLNAYDAGGAVYDESGRRIGICSYAWGKVDSICRQLSDCETVYRVADNIWGQPPVDKYGLGR